MGRNNRRMKEMSTSDKIILYSTIGVIILAVIITGLFLYSKNLNDEGMTAEDTFTATSSDGNITVKSSHYLNSDNFAYDFHFTGAGGTYTGSLDHVENCVMTIKLECNGLTGTLVVNYRTGVNGINVPSVSF